VSVNLFELLCDEVTTTPSNLGSITMFGGPILYLIVMGCILFSVLVMAQSGSIMPRQFTCQRGAKPVTSRKKSLWRRSPKPDVAAEARAVSTSNDVLRVMRISKAYDNNKVVDDVSLGVSRDTLFALLGPSGAGKTVTFSVISGDVKPDKGEIYINGVSVIRQPRVARLSLGLCPQFTAIDSQLTVREHLEVYARLKGLGPAAMHRDIDLLMEAIKLTLYAERPASKLSGGNQRKLSLAIALLGKVNSVMTSGRKTKLN
jgi:ATP-binding cassette subfamily A (ABC1) protein 3